LGQTPSVDKVQSELLKQLTGEVIPADATEDEKQRLLRHGMVGKRVCLLLDDLWEAQHEKWVNFVDTTLSRVVISTRVRGLLANSARIAINAPSEEDAIKIVMAAANMPAGSRPPRAAAEIVRQCGRLPLALGMAGKLLISLGLDSAGESAWDGVSEILKQELRESVGAERASSEQRVIRASLAGLRGSERDVRGVKNLFKLFGL
jgi:hypothetical protein